MFYTEEADLLGDRIAIMGTGKVLCNGTSMFLKHQQGAGYTLSLETSDDCDEGGLTDLLKQVSFQWKNPDFLSKNPDFLLKNVAFIIKTARARVLGSVQRRQGEGLPAAYGGQVWALRNRDFQLKSDGFLVKNDDVVAEASQRCSMGSTRRRPLWGLLTMECP